MNTLRKLTQLRIALFFAFVLQSCTTDLKPTIFNGSDQEFVAAILSGVTQSGSSALNEQPIRRFFAQAFSLLPEVSASSSCAAFSNSACGGGIGVTLNYNFCNSNQSNGSIWNGSEILSFGSNAQCLAGLPVCGAGNNLTRTFGANTSRSTAGWTLNLDTTTPSGYQNPQVAGGYTVAGSATGNTLTINGIHLTGTGPSDYGDPKKYDLTFSTSPALGGAPLNVNIPNCSNNARSISSGTVVVENNAYSYTTLISINNVTWNTTSCFPQSGSVSSPSTAGPNASSGETLNFLGNGKAKLVFGADTNHGELIDLFMCF